MDPFESLESFLSIFSSSPHRERHLVEDIWVLLIELLEQLDLVMRFELKPAHVLLVLILVLISESKQREGLLLLLIFLFFLLSFWDT